MLADLPTMQFWQSAKILSHDIEIEMRFPIDCSQRPKTGELR